MQTERLVYANVSFPAGRYDAGRVAQFYDRLAMRLKGMPAVEGVSFGGMPLASNSGRNRVFTIDGVNRTFADRADRGMTAPCLLVKSSGGAMDEPRQRIDGEELDLPLNQEPGTAAPEIEINYEIERGKRRTREQRA